jgi:flagellar protein FlbT
LDKTIECWRCTQKGFIPATLHDRVVADENRDRNPGQDNPGFLSTPLNGTIDIHSSLEYKKAAAGRERLFSRRQSRKSPGTSEEQNPMALKITLKPNERVIIAGAAIRNGPSAASLLVENNVPILRGKDILKEKDSLSPAQKIYFIIQIMYLDQENLPAHHKLYWDLVRSFIKAAPSSLRLIDEISEHILGSRYYKALKTARKLIDYEKSILSRNNLTL